MDNFARFVAFVLILMVIYSYNADCRGFDYGCDVSETLQPAESKLFIWIVGYYPPESFHNSTCTRNDSLDENSMIIWCSHVCKNEIFFGIQNRTCSCMNKLIDMAMFSTSTEPTAVSSTAISTNENYSPVNKTTILPVPVHNNTITTDNGTTSLPIEETTGIMGTITSVSGTYTKLSTNLTAHGNDTITSPPTTPSLTSSDINDKRVPDSQSTPVTTPLEYQTTASTEENFLTVYFKEREVIPVPVENQDNEQQTEMIGFQRKCATVKGDRSSMGFSLSERNCCDRDIFVLCQSFDSKANDFKHYTNSSSASDWFAANKYCRKIDTSLFNGHDFHKANFFQNIQDGSEYWTGLIIFYSNTSRSNANVKQSYESDFLDADYSGQTKSTSAKDQSESLVLEHACSETSTTMTQDVTTNQQTSTDQSESLVSEHVSPETSTTMIYEVTSNQQTNTAEPESTASTVISSTSEFQSAEPSWKVSFGTIHADTNNFTDTTQVSLLRTSIGIVNSSRAMPNLITNSQQSHKGISNGVLGAIIAVAVVAVAAIVGIVIYLKRRRRSNVEKKKDEEKSVLHSTNHIRNITPGYQDVDITETALSETSLPEVQVENLSRITHINKLYGHSAIQSDTIDSDNVPGVRNTDNRNNAYAMVIKPKQPQMASSNSKDCLPIKTLVDGEYIGFHENVEEVKEMKNQNGKLSNLKSENVIDDAEVNHLQGRKTKGSDEVYDYAKPSGTSSDRDLYDHFDNKKHAMTDSTYDSFKPTTTFDRNSDTYDHMPNGKNPIATADDVYDHVTNL